MDKSTFHILCAQYTKGYLDGQPREGYHPHAQPSGPFIRAYNQGYADASETRKKLPDATFGQLTEEEAFAQPLIAFLRNETSAIDHRITSSAEVYNIQTHAAERFFAEHQEKAIVSAYADKIEAELTRRAAARKAPKPSK